MSTVEQAEIFEAERPRLLRVAARVLDDRAEAEDVVQQAWLRLHRTDADIESLPFRSRQDGATAQKSAAPVRGGA